MTISQNLLRAMPHRLHVLCMKAGEDSRSASKPTHPERGKKDQI